MIVVIAACIFLLFEKHFILNWFLTVVEIWWALLSKELKQAASQTYISSQFPSLSMKMMMQGHPTAQFYSRAMGPRDTGDVGRSRSSVTKVTTRLGTSLHGWMTPGMNHCLLRPRLGVRHERLTQWFEWTPLYLHKASAKFELDDSEQLKWLWW